MASSALRLAAASGLLLALWVSAAVAEDVEPLGPVDLGEAPKTDATVAMMQKVVAQYQAQSTETAAKDDAIKTASKVFEAELDKSAAEGNKVAAGIMADDGPAMAGPAMADSDASPVVKKGLQVIDSVNAEANKLATELQDTQTQLVAKTEEAYKNKLQKEVLNIKQKYNEERESNPVAPTYREVPYFMFTSLSKKVDADSKAACEKVCSMQPKCQSFTWNMQPKVCYWSVSKLHYDNNYVYAAKLRTPLEGEPDKKFTDTPGLRWTTPMSKNLFKVSWNECKDSCLKDGLSCQSVSYKKDTRTCSRSSESLPTSKYAYYFEKQASKADQEEQAAIKTAEAQSNARFKHYEAHQKAKTKAESAQLAREAAQKKGAKEIYTKQEPDKSQEVKMKQQVESQVNAANAEIAKKAEAEKVKQQEKEMEANAKAKAELLKKLQVVIARQQKFDQEQEAAKSHLSKMAQTIKLGEDAAKEATDDLNKKLADVKAAHEEAVEALQSFRESEKQKASAEAQDAAKLTIRTTHSKLQEVVKEAEFRHTKEVKKKKQINKLIGEESAAESDMKATHKKTMDQRQKDKDFVTQAREKMAKDAERIALGKYKTEETRFEVLKFKEVEAKKKLAESSGHYAAGEENLKNAKLDDKSSIRQHVATYKEKVGKSKNSVKSLDAEFKESLARLTGAKERYHKLGDDDGAVKKKARKDEDRKIESATHSLGLLAAEIPSW
jgi:hypothetical protein